MSEERFAVIRQSIINGAPDTAGGLLEGLPGIVCPEHPAIA